jgi:hypothetical protein
MSNVSMFSLKLFAIHAQQVKNIEQIQIIYMHGWMWLTWLKLHELTVYIIMQEQSLLKEKLSI